MKIFVAGAAGVIGRLLLPKLLEAGHEVVGMTHKEENRAFIEKCGAQAVIGCLRSRGHICVHSQSTARSGYPSANFTKSAEFLR